MKVYKLEITLPGQEPFNKLYEEENSFEAILSVLVELEIHDDWTLLDMMILEESGCYTNSKSQTIEFIYIV